MNNVEYLRAQEERKITLNDWCEAYYNTSIIPFPPEHIEFIRQVAELTIEKHNTSIGPKKRVNEQGNDNENFLLSAQKEVLGDNFKSLGNGYPDINGSTPILPYQLASDSKIIKNIVDKNSFRMFYTSTPKERTKKKKKSPRFISSFVYFRT